MAVSPDPAAPPDPAARPGSAPSPNARGSLEAPSLEAPSLEASIRNRRPPSLPPEPWSWEASQPLPIHYDHHNEALGIAFCVQRLPFAALQVLDPRLVRIPPGASNELHRHAHESLFVVLEGEAEILVGTESVRLQRGGIAFAPRWIVHQSRNISAERELLLLAITDFGLTSSVLGDYDRQTRLRHGGRDAIAP